MVIEEELIKVKEARQLIRKFLAEPENQELMRKIKAERVSQNQNELSAVCEN